MNRIQSIETFYTKRLIAKCFGADDYDALCRLHRDPKVMATLGGVRSDDETRQFLREKMDHWDRHGFGYWMFRDRETGQFAGRGGLQHINVGGNLEVEVGYTVQAPCWGRGLATEMTKALLAVGFEQLGLDSIVSFTLTTNLASQRVMQKAGLRFERNIIHFDEPHVLYRITCDRYVRLQPSE